VKPHHHLRAAIGYLELDMPIDAADELESLPPEDRTRSEVLRIRCAIYTKTESWELLDVVAKEMAKREPKEPLWVINMAFATRRYKGIPDARKILLKADKEHPDCGLIQYNLACYDCVEGNVGGAKERLSKAITLDGNLRRLALDDPDLDAIFGLEKN